MAKVDAAHMCRDGHEEIYYNDSEHELCPICRAMNALSAKEAECKAMRKAIGRADKKLAKVFKLSVFDTVEKAAIIVQEARADLENAIK